MLSLIDPDEVSPHDRVVVVRATARMTAYFASRNLDAIASVADLEIEPEPGMARDGAAAELRGAMRLTRRAAESEVDLALYLRDRVPRVFEAFRAGAIDRRRAWVIAQATSHLSDEVVERIVDVIVEEAPRLTTGQLGARIRRLAQEADTDGAADRYVEAVSERRVVVEANPDGTADLMGCDLPPHRVKAIARLINRIAMRLKTADESRTLDQIRADVFLDLLEGRAHHGGKGATVDLRVDLATLARMADTPGDLAGFGPVVADIARQVADQQPDAEWRFVVTHPDTGRPVANGTTARRGTASQRRTAQQRDLTCIFPGCRAPATECDLDHRTPWSETQRTRTDDLAAGCRYDHWTIRHQLGWRHIPLPGGDYLWTSPLGHRYTTSGRSP